MNIHAHHRGRRITTRPDIRHRRWTPDFPGWDHPNYLQHLQDIPAGLGGTITHVESHGNAPFTRYTVRFDDGTRTSGLNPADVTLEPTGPIRAVRADR